ncbi:MarR family transcriptional regulator [Epibacterium ulvae]|uniref:MarR family winged helix-turn-helix transcriptional regulator n=1 Tax=Epibacterium ulvae TaxID=1156985 RepID=UPI001BFC683F|nr:MarR family transcriptional regulator [Epibacterium ulvae]MBT8154662.1 MarR family transcriptional regulator [Epibacterium ulvae]
MTDFDLKDFTPYLLNLAAETSSAGFQAYYKDRYGMLRTEWRVLFHLGRYGPLTAKEICERARIHKTKVSRAVSALEDKRYLLRREQAEDRRLETLRLTEAGKKVFKDLYKEAARFDLEMMSDFTAEEHAILHKCLTKIAAL